MSNIYRGYISSISGKGLLDKFRNTIKDKMIEADTLPIMMEHSFHGAHEKHPLETDIAEMKKSDYFIFIIEAFGGNVIGEAISRAYPTGCPYTNNQVLHFCKDCKGENCALTYVQFEYLYAMSSKKPCTVLLHKLSKKPAKYIMECLSRFDNKGGSIEDYLSEQINSPENTNHAKFVDIINRAGNRIEYEENDFSSKCHKAIHDAKMSLNNFVLPYDYIPLKYLGYDPAEGTIINFDENGGKERQVVLRVDTFNNLLDFIWDYIKDDKHVFGETGVKQLFYESLLYSCGRKCGWDFAKRNFDSFQSPGNNNIKNFINKLCEFDTKVGFGNIKLTELSEINDKGCKTFECVISVSKNFLANKEVETERCCFIRGYFEGAIKYFARQSGYGNRCKIHVDCKDNNVCQKKGLGGLKCEYTIYGSPTLTPEKKKWKIEEIISEEIPS
jgi:hypothetical protein